MARNTAAVRTYGRQSRRTKALVSVDVLEQTTPAPRDPAENKEKEVVDKAPGDEEPVLALTEKLGEIRIEEPQPKTPTRRSRTRHHSRSPTKPKPQQPATAPPSKRPQKSRLTDAPSPAAAADHPVLSWSDVCPPGGRIEKIAEASYAEVYRITNERGTSIIKVVRLESPIKPQTKAQEKSGLVDEEPHREEDLGGEVRISEWLADIPGFVVYKERFVVKGKATKELLETHQAFHRRMKRKDPDRLQFYPSPSRYLPETEFLVLELGDAGTSLEDFELDSIDQVWDILLLVAIALARAEYQVGFEHRDLHEGNLCVRRVRPPRAAAATEGADPTVRFGYSGLDITILDYGLSRAEDPEMREPRPIAFDLEKDLSLFTSTHAPQCKVYRQMRSYLIKGDRAHLPPRFHTKPLEAGTISWSDHHPYTNVLWLAYIYEYMVKHFCGLRKGLTGFKAETTELWAHLNPDAPAGVQSFSSAADVVRFVVEAGWVTEAQVTDGDGQAGDGDEEDEDVSIIEVRAPDREEEPRLRRSPRRRQACAT